MHLLDFSIALQDLYAELFLPMKVTYVRTCMHFGWAGLLSRQAVNYDVSGVSCPNILRGWNFRAFNVAFCSDLSLFKN